MIQEEDYLKAKQVVQEYEKQLNKPAVIRCKFSAIISIGAAYMVCDEEDNIIGYSDTLGMIDYDKDFKHKPYTGKIEIISVDESAFG